jgi:hypothetical protein
LGALSYRRSFDGADILMETGFLETAIHPPIVGVNVKNFMFAYTHSHVTGPVQFDTGGYHQITLGVDLFCKASQVRM